MKKNIIFESKLSNISIVENLIDEISEQFNIDSVVYGNILVSLVEAVNNAIKHGNKLDNTKKVTIDIEVDEQALNCSICDEGTGFDPVSVPDPTTIENIDKPHGRGVFLMQQLADKVEYQNNGCRVDMYFRLS